MLSDDSISGALHGAALWLTPKVVEEYAPGGLRGPAGVQERLRAAVGAFGSTAGDVPPDQPPTRDQFARAPAAFRELTGAVREAVLGEWTDAVNALLRDVEGWVVTAGWRSRRVEWKTTETPLGAYTLPQLRVFADADLYVSEPVARFVPGATGRMT